MSLSDQIGWGKARELNTLGFKLWYIGEVSIIMDKMWKNNVVEVKRINDWILSFKMVFEWETFSIINVHAPQLGLEEHDKLKFWEELEGLVQGIPL